MKLPALELAAAPACPQKEATPTEKAPLERAWRTIKDALAPLLSLTNRVAARVPQLRDTPRGRAAAVAPEPRPSYLQA